VTDGSGKPWSRLGLCVVLGLVIGGFVDGAPASESQRTQILVPLPAGTVIDTIARVVAEELSADLSRPFVVVNRPAASGILAFGDAAVAEPDGYTLIFSGQSQLTIQPHIQSKLPYEADSFVPICQMFATPFAVVVGANSPISNFQDLVTKARAQPGSVNWSHLGFASVPQLQATLLANATGIDVVWVPYRSLGEMVKDLMAGTIDVTVMSIGSFSEVGNRVIAVLNSKRSATFPDAPTVAELGYPVSLTAINGLFAVKGTPRPVIERLEAACAKAFASPKFREMARRLDINADLLIGDAFAKRLAEESREMKVLVDKFGIRIP
jgi:tripartite-type tricarboxylate transporter receptor subunit TctC